jgi:hypothetical protein
MAQTSALAVANFLLDAAEAEKKYTSEAAKAAFLLLRLVCREQGQAVVF